MKKKEIGKLFVIGYQGTNPSDDFLRFVEEWGIGGVIVFARNIDKPEKLPLVLNRIQEAAGQKIFTAIDQEGGLVMRILSDGSLFHSVMGLAATGDPLLIEKSHEAIGKEMLALGLNWNLAPVLDINHPQNPGIGARSFGDTPEMVAEYGCAAIRGLQKTGVLACAKHFPGKGNAKVDSHLTLPVIPHSANHLEQNELFPFKKAILENVAAIMTAHVFFPAFESAPDLPATLSKSVLTGLLRNKLGFKGLLITDDLEMGAITEKFGIHEAAAMSFSAGADLLLICHQLEQQKAAAERLLSLVNSDAHYGIRLEESLNRIKAGLKRLEVKPTSKNISELKVDHEALVKTSHEQSLRFLKFQEAMVSLKTTEKILFVYPEISALVQVEEVHKEQGIEDLIKKEFPYAVCAKFSPTEPHDSIMKKVLSVVPDETQVKLVLFSYNAHLFPGQKKAANELAARFKDSAVVALRNPYDLRELKGFGTAMAAFSFRTPAIKAALNALKGKTRPATSPWPIDIADW